MRNDGRLTALRRGILCRRGANGAAKLSDSSGAIQSGRPRVARGAGPELPRGPVGNHGPVDVRSTPEAVADGAQFRRRSLSLTRPAGRTMITPNLTAAHGENQHEGTFDDEGHSRPQPRVTVVD